MPTQPTLFLSHGAPDLILHPEDPAHAFLTALGTTMTRPRAIVVASAHWETRTLAVEHGTRPRTIHDFSGFPAALYQRRYPAPGNPALADQLCDLLADWHPVPQERGYDHGVWAPLSLMFPAADIPVVAVSLLHGADGAEHLRLGQALESLRHDNVLVIGSGSATHNLGALRHGPPPLWVTAFDDWLAKTAEQGDTKALANYRTLAPHARENHPSEEHLLPLLVALGAAGPGAKGKALHRGIAYGVLSMTAFAFTTGAA